jgi:hypothetical protein
MQIIIGVLACCIRSADPDPDATHAKKGALILPQLCRIKENTDDSRR